MYIPLNYHDNGRYHGAWNIIYNYEQHFLYQLHHLHKNTVLGSHLLEITASNHERLRFWLCAVKSRSCC